VKSLKSTSPIRHPTQNLEADDDRIVRWRRGIDEQKAERSTTTRRLNIAAKKKEQLEEREESALKAQAFITKVAKQTQQKLEYHISNLVSMAEAAVFDEPYEFEVKFEQRRNKTECDLFFSRSGSLLDPVDSTGGGSCDVASFALRCAFLNLNRQNRQVLILDEPFKNVSVDLQEKASDMIKHVSEKIGIQVIMVSHLPRIIGAADKLFEVEMVRGKSKVKEI